MNDEKLNKLVNYLKDLEDDEIMEMWNDYCRDVNNECEIYPMGCFAEMFDSTDLISVVEKICYGNFHIRDSYFVFSGYGNLESFDSYDLYGYIYYNDLANYIIRENEHFNDEEIKKILEQN